MLIMPSVKKSLIVEQFQGNYLNSVIESIAVMYELTKRTQEMLFADWAQ